MNALHGSLYGLDLAALDASVVATSLAGVEAASVHGGWMRLGRRS